MNFSILIFDPCFSPRSKVQHRMGSSDALLTSPRSDSVQASPSRTGPGSMRGGRGSFRGGRGRGSIQSRSSVGSQSQPRGGVSRSLSGKLGSIFGLGGSKSSNK